MLATVKYCWREAGGGSKEAAEKEKYGHPHKMFGSYAREEFVHWFCEDH